MTIFRDDVVAIVPHLRAFARTLTRGDTVLADDLVQDTVVSALQARDRFREGTNLKAWLFTILRNRFRSVVARKHVTAEVGTDDLGELSWTGPDQESRLEVTAFKRAFRALSPAQREVLVLAGVHGLPYERIAEICGCEVGTVKSRVCRARLQLKRMLLGEVPLPPAEAGTQVGVGPRLRQQRAPEPRPAAVATAVPSSTWAW
jgi:RNA polymerase sigma-70 factor (ECF subfamily)